MCGVCVCGYDASLFFKDTEFLFDERRWGEKELPNNERCPSLIEACRALRHSCCPIAYRTPHQREGGLCLHTGNSVESMALRFAADLVGVYDYTNWYIPSALCNGHSKVDSWS